MAGHICFLRVLFQSLPALVRSLRYTALNEEPKLLKSRSKQVIGGPALVLLASVLWGTTGTAQHLAPQGATPLTIGALRLVVGGTVLWSFIAARSRMCRPAVGGAVMPTSETRRRQRLAWHPGVFAASIGVAAYQLTFFAGVDRTGVAVGTLVAIGSAPIWAGLFEMLLWGQKPPSRWVGATTSAIVGSAFLVGSGGRLGVDFGGVLLTLAAGASFAMYTVSNKAALRRFPDEGDRIVASALFGGGLLLLPVLLFTDTSWVQHPRGIIVVLHLGLLATAAAYALFGRGLAAVSAATATTLTLAEPLTAALLGMIVLGERLSPTGQVGGLLVLAGLLLLTSGHEPGAGSAAEQGRSL